MRRVPAHPVPEHEIAALHTGFPLSCSGPWSPSPCCSSTVASAQDACRRGYAVAQQLVANPGVAQFAYGDFNGDGRLDLLAYGDTLVVLLNRGGEVYEPRVQTRAPFWGGLLYAADVTGDGHLDAIVRNSWEVAVAPGLGDGTFAPFVLTRGLPTGSLHLLVDLDGDRLPEFVDHDTSDASKESIVSYTPQRDGSFRLSSSHPSGSLADSYMPPLVAGDFDGDGRIDLMHVTTSKYEFVIAHVYWNEGGGTFTTKTVLLDQVRIRGADVAPVELDGDTATELAAIHGGLLYIFELDGRQFSYRTKKVSGRTVDSPPQLVGAADLDRDGALDLVFGRAEMTVLWGPRDPEDSYVAATFDFRPQTLADVNGDGITDILSIPGEGLDIIHGAAGTRNLRAAPVLPQRAVSSRKVFEADFDRDGQMDLAVEGVSNASTTLLRREGSAFTEKTHFGIHGVQAVADLDGDGHLDLVTRQGEGPGPTSVHFGRGDFTFDAPLQVSANSWFEGVVTRSAGGYALLFLTPAGGVESVSLQGRSAATVPVAEVVTHDAVAIADVDGDGDSDLVAGQRNAHRFLIQDAGGWTSRAVDFGLDVDFDDVTAGDLDRDGRADLLLFDWDARYSPMLARGDGTYVAIGGARTASSSLNSLLLEDVDRDGLLDLVMTGEGFVMVHRNTGSAFEGYGLFRIGRGPGTVLEDFDDDGWEDLLVAHDGSVTVLLNTCTAPLVRAAVTPARALEGEPITLTVTTEGARRWSPGPILVRRNGAVLHVAYLDNSDQFGSFAITLPPLPAGTHVLEVEYQDRYAGTTSTTVTVTVGAREKRRRAVRNR